MNDAVQNLFFDFFAIGRPDHVVTSQRYSSFSMTSALVHGKNITVAFARPALRAARPSVFGACARHFHFTDREQYRKPH